MITIVASRGNVYLLAALYAFGVIWSFALISLAVLVLRYTSPENRQWKVPGNFHIGKTEIPVGLAIISLILFMTAAVAKGAKPLVGQALRRAKAALGRVAKAPEPFDVKAGRARFAAAFEGRWAA